MESINQVSRAAFLIPFGGVTAAILLFAIKIISQRSSPQGGVLEAIQKGETNYRLGLRSREKDPSTAIEHFKKAAAEDHPQANYELGCLALSGKPEDRHGIELADCVGYMEKAHELGDIGAESCLLKMHMQLATDYIETGDKEKGYEYLVKKSAEGPSSQRCGIKQALVAEYSNWLIENSEEGSAHLAAMAAAGIDPTWIAEHKIA